MDGNSTCFTILLCLLILARILALTTEDDDQSPCAAISYHVVTTQDEARELSEMLLHCSDEGQQFEVDWSGQVVLDETISVPSGVSLIVTGSPLSSSSLSGNAVIDGGGDIDFDSPSPGVQIFDVGENAYLELSSLSLVRGNGWGGAASISEGSRVVARDCSFAGNHQPGTIAISRGSISFEGRTEFTNNNANNNGGAIHAIDGVVSFEGETIFTGNTAFWEGGAIYGEGGSVISFDGETTFSENNASYGGAVFCRDCDVSFNGRTEFYANEADTTGGAFYSDSSSVSFEGETVFTSNIASSRPGGAVGVRNCSLSFEGETVFRENVATVDNGGALYVFSGSSVTMDAGNVSFTNNVAGGSGGAVIAADGASLTIRGPTTFLNNTAQGEGGGLYVIESTVATAGGVNFTNNTAVNGAGGGVHCSISVASFEETTFTGNRAVWGGGLALFSTGTLWDADDPASGAANTTMCVFEQNIANDGGGMYTASGYDIIEGTRFEENTADGSGGGYIHSGVLVRLNTSTFVKNRAGDDGPAIMSLGIAETFGSVTFDANTLYCDAGQYSYEDSDTTCRFDVVCSRCTGSCPPADADIVLEQDGRIPTCQANPHGVISEQTGVSLEALDLDVGYYRTSATSLEILECHREEACVGGTVAGEYCTPGYRGAYCAACEEGYRSGYHYSCVSCVGNSKQSATAATCVALVIAFSFVTLLVVDLVRVVSDDDNVASLWSIWRDRVVKAVPLTAVKIVLVSWQILTQFASVVDVVYPEVYENFLSALNLFNLDLGFILSLSCVADINFYGRLLFATMSPLAVLGALGVTYAVARKRNRHSPKGLLAARSKHLSVALFVMFIVYSSVSFIVFQTFACEMLDNGVNYLRADYSLTCTTSRHKVWMGYAGVMILVYPIGVPAVFAWWLVSHRHELVNVNTDDISSVSDTLRPMRDLWEPYKPRRYYYEVVECGRRIVLTGLGVFLFPGSSAQVALEVVFAAVFMVLSEMILPFVDPMDAWLYRCGTWVVFFSMYLALLLKVDASAEDDESQETFASILIAANACLVLAVVFQAVMSVKKGIVSMRDLPVANKSFHCSSLLEVCDEESKRDHRERGSSKTSTNGGGGSEG